MGVFTVLHLLDVLQLANLVWPLLIDAGILALVVGGIGGVVKFAARREWEHQYDKRFAKYKQRLEKELDLLRQALSLTQAAFETRYGHLHKARFEASRQLSWKSEEVAIAVSVYTQTIKPIYAGETAEEVEVEQAQAAHKAARDFAAALRRNRIFLSEDTARELEAFRDAAFDAIWYRARGETTISQATEMSENLRRRASDGGWVSPEETEASKLLFTQGKDLKEKAERAAEQLGAVRVRLHQDLRELIAVAEPDPTQLELNTN